MDLNPFVQERLSRSALQAQQLLAAASLRAVSVVHVAAAYRRAYVVSRALQKLSS
jgi:hypothetical protein